MKLQMLAVDKNVEFSLKEQAAWLKKGVTTVRVDTMREAIVQLKQSIFIIIAINADNVDYTLYLKEMRYLTNAFIFVVTSYFDVYGQEKAVALGADLYGRFLDDPDKNVASALAFIETHIEQIKKKSERINKQKKQPKTIHFPEEDIH